MSGGFSFGTPANTQAGTLGGTGIGLNLSTGFGAAKTTASTGFGTTATATPSTGFGLGGTPAPSGFTLGGGGLGTTVAAQPSTGFALGTAGTPSTGLSLGGLGTGLGGSAATTTTTASGLTFGGIGGTPSLGGTSLGGTTLGAGAAGTTSTGLTLGTGTGLGLGAATSAVKPTLTLGGFGTTTTSTATGFGTTGLGTLNAKPGGLLGATPNSQAVATTTSSRGLGGIDPQTTTTATGTTSTNGKSGDSKAVRETPMPHGVCSTVEDFKKYVKEQKSVREEIARMSSKPMYKVQEEVASLKQLLSLVTNGLQRNALTIDKLKQESAQELKHAEIAQRTKDTPPGLQYENTAPTLYFQRLVETYEQQMLLYRQQIEEMESHLASLHHPAMLTPQELSLLLRKIYESFVALAAQLQAVHEAVKIQKEHYLNYRKVFHSETIDIFEKRKKAKEKAKQSKMQLQVGPAPFTGISNAAAIAMVTALNRAQQPGAGAGGAPTLGLQAPGALGTQPTGLGGGLFGHGTAPQGIGGLGSTGFGASTGTGLFGSTSTTTQASTGFGFGSLTAGTSTNTATVRPLGSTFGTPAAGFGSPASSAGFGAPPAGTGFGFGSPQPTQGTLTNADGSQPFQLQRPPLGNKRGKKS